MPPRLPKGASGAIDESHIHRLATETAPESRRKLRAAGAASDDDYLAPGHSRTHLTASSRRHRGVGDLPDSGINGINHAATRAKVILEIGLYNPAGTDLGLIGN